MNRPGILATIVIICTALGSAARADENLQVLPEKIDDISPRDMMNHCLRNEAQQHFEALSTFESSEIAY